MTFNLIKVPRALLQTTEGKYNMFILHVWVLRDILHIINA